MVVPSQTVKLFVILRARVTVWNAASPSASFPDPTALQGNRPQNKSFRRILADHHLDLMRGRTEILQLNLGKLCNLTCIHCHVNAGPKRKEIISRETIDRIVEWLARTDIEIVDLTGGAPEMVPDFRYLVERLCDLPHVKTIIDRCNLTILLEPWLRMAGRFSDCSSFENRRLHAVLRTRRMLMPKGETVSSMRVSRALQLLNRLGCGRQDDLILDLVYNPNGAFLPPDQAELESDYKRELKEHFGIDFHHLYTITNMPIAPLRLLAPAQRRTRSLHAAADRSIQSCFRSRSHVPQYA